nr:hypothetical protein [Tanacetum cinerariifolium]
VKENQEKDKIGSKPDKNGKRGEAGKSLKQLQWGDEEGDADENVEEVNAGDVAEGDDSAAHGDVSAAHGEVPTVAEGQCIPSPTPTTPPPQPPQDIPSTSQVQQTPPQSPQALEITKLKRRVKKLERRNKVRVLKLRRLQKVGTSQRVETSEDTVMDDESNQKRMIDEMDQDDVVVLEDDKRRIGRLLMLLKMLKRLRLMREDETEPAKVQEVVDVVTTIKLIIEVVTATTETVTTASAIITTVEAQVPTATLTAAPARRAAKSKKLDEEVEELKIHLQIVPNEDDDVYTEATPLAQKRGLGVFMEFGERKIFYNKAQEFFDDFLLVTLGAMFEKPDIHAQIWKNQRTVHGPTKVKGWKLLESCGV